MGVQMVITVIGAGYVGLITAACLAERHEVLCVEKNTRKLEFLMRGVPTIYEPGLRDQMQKVEKSLSFTNRILKSDVYFLCVGTPQSEDGAADITDVLEAAREIARSADDEYFVVACKSTVPVGTCDEVASVIRETRPDADFDVVSNPEFLREGTALEDFKNPDRIVIGSESELADARMMDVYMNTGGKLFLCDVRSAEMIKYASNAMLAARISFINEIANICEKVGADVSKVSQGVGVDSRIGPQFLRAGIGYGGSCFPKDVRALAHTARLHGINPRMLDCIDDVNERQKTRFVSMLVEHFEFRQKPKVAILGLAFKPDTDDVRESPALAIARELLRLGFELLLHDPIASENAQLELEPSQNVTYCESFADAVLSASAVVICTEWDCYRNSEMILNAGSVELVLDGRNILNRSRLFMKSVGVGR